MLAHGHRRLVHRFARIWAVLQLVLPLVVTFADARSEIASVRSTSHVESHSTAACVPVHGDNCALCRFLSTANGQTPSAPSICVSAASAPMPRAASRVARPAAGRELPPSRAPPRN